MAKNGTAIASHPGEPLSVSRIRPVSKQLLALAFAVIASSVVAAQAFAYFRAAEIQRNVTSITENALESILLVERMGRDVQQQQILIDAHILTQDVPTMAALDRRIAASREDYADAARAYAPLTTFPGEPKAWEQLQHDVIASGPPIEHVLAMSRVNQDVQARAAFDALQPLLSAIARDVETLVQINRTTAQKGVATVRRLERGQIALRLALAIFVVGVTLAVALWVLRLVRRWEDQVTRYAATLESWNAELDAFAGRVAHDLLSPLSATQLSLQLLAKLDDPRISKMTNMGLKSVGRIRSVVEGLYDFAATGGQVDPAMHTAAREAVAAIVEELAAQARAVNIELTFHHVPDGEVGCRPELIGIALTNLIRNAIKFMGERDRRRIDVTVLEEPGGLRFEVADTGPGLPPGLEATVFQPYVRGETKQRGLGLGLATVKRLVEAHAGRVGYRPTEGGGATFWFTLPATAPPRARTVEARA